MKALAALHLVLQLCVGDVAGVARFAYPVQGDTVAVAGRDVAIDAVDRHVELPPGNHFAKGRVRPIEDLGERGLPVESAGLLAPILKSVGIGAVVDVGAGVGLLDELGGGGTWPDFADILVR